MSRTARSWLGVGPMALTGLALLLCGASVRADEPPPLAEQLSGLGRQALDLGREAEAAAFFHRALRLDPDQAEARKALDGPLRQVAYQDPEAEPAPPADVPAPVDEPDATLE